MSNSTMHYAFIHTGRLMRRFLRNRSAMVNTFVIPSLMLLVMRMLFGDLIAASQQRETPNVLPIMVMMIIASQWMMSTNTAGESIRLRATGLDDRVSVTPGGAWALFIGQAISYWMHCVLGAIPTVIVGLLLGARIHNTSTIIILAVTILVSSVGTAAMSAWFTNAADDPQALMAATPILMATMFLSNGMVATSAFASVVQPVVRNNPLGHVITMVQNMNESLPIGNHGWCSLAWAVGLFVLFSVLAIIAFRRRLPSS